MARALYDDRSLLKVLGMRRTMFVMPRNLAGVVQAAVTDALAAAERKRMVQMVTGAGIDEDVEGWIADVERQTLEALELLGSATANELAKRVPGLRLQISFGEGRKWAGQVGVSTRMLFLLATEGRVVRGKPRGTWLSSLYEWAPTAKWLGSKLDRPPADIAQCELVRRYLAAYGPATARDVQWWTGWTVATTKKALAASGAAEVALDQGEGFALSGDKNETAAVSPWVALLPALDTTTMGWAGRGWFLGRHAGSLFDRNGNAGPTVWADGRVVGGWAQRKSGEVVYRLLEDIGRRAEQRVGAQAARLESWLGDSRIIPRFRTPLEAELTA